MSAFDQMAATGTAISKQYNAATYATLVSLTADHLAPLHSLRQLHLGGHARLKITATLIEPVIDTLVTVVVAATATSDLNW